MNDHGPGEVPRGRSGTGKEGAVSQHRKNTPDRPSRWWLWGHFTASVASLTMVLRLLDAPVWGEAHLIGVVFGVFTSTVFLAWAGQVMVRRANPGEDKVYRQLDEATRTRKAYNDDPGNAGAWVGARPEQVLTVRWDPAAHTFFFLGWLSDQWMQYREQPWHDPVGLADVLIRLESSGTMRPLDNPGTRAVRARLNLGEWVEPQPDDPPRSDEDSRLAREETVRLIDRRRWRDAERASTDS